MIETDIMVGAGMKLTCSRDDFVSKPFAPAELRAILLRYFPGGAAHVPLSRDGAPATVRGPVPKPSTGALSVDQTVDPLVNTVNGLLCQSSSGAPVKPPGC